MSGALLVARAPWYFRGISLFGMYSTLNVTPAFALEKSAVIWLVPFSSPLPLRGREGGGGGGGPAGGGAGAAKGGGGGGGGGLGGRGGFGGGRGGGAGRGGGGGPPPRPAGGERPPRRCERPAAQQ